MRTCILVTMGTATSLLAGCASTDSHTLQADSQPCPPAVVERAGFAAAPLFDRRPGPYHASQFTWRSDWPSTDAFYSPGQVIYFSERFVDFQGRGFYGSDYTYRRFDTYRAGVGFR